MLIVSPDCGTSRPDSMLACLLGDPWSVRLAGAGSDCTDCPNSSNPTRATAAYRSVAGL